MVLCFSSGAALSQIQWRGIYDFQALKGGEDSSPIRNGLVNEYIQLNAYQFQFFLEAQIQNNISLTAMLSNNTAGSSDLKGVEFQLAYVTFSNIVNDALSVSIGKMITPFGSFAKRQLAPDNPLIGKPLFMGYGLNLSPITGYLDSLGGYSSLGQYNGRLCTMYAGGYFTGAEIFGSLLDGFFEYDAAVMNAPLSSTTSDYNIDENLAFHGRAAFHPAIWGTIGMSYASGSFMQPALANRDFETEYSSLGRFRQSTVGADMRISWLYYELNAEYLSNNFDTPYITSGFGSVYENGLPNSLSLPLESTELLLDVKIDAPFYPGLFLALRYDMLNFNSIKDPDVHSSTFGSTIPWDRNVTRYSAGIGFRPHRSILIKIGYEKTDVDLQPAPELDVMECAVVVVF